MDKPSVAERIDPKSPHYDPEFAALRVKAMAAWADHLRDMGTNPEYRAAAERRYKRLTHR